MEIKEILEERIYDMKKVAQVFKCTFCERSIYKRFPLFKETYNV